MDENKKKLLEQKVEFVPLAPYAKPGVIAGLKLPDGTIMLNMEPRTSAATLAMYRKQLSATTIQVKGTWTFTPDVDSIQEFRTPNGH